MQYTFPPISCSPNFNAEEPTLTFVMQCDFMFDCTLSCCNVIKMNLNRQKFLTNLFTSMCVCVLMHICGWTHNLITVSEIDLILNKKYKFFMSVALILDCSISRIMKRVLICFSAERMCRWGAGERLSDVLPGGPPRQRHRTPVSSVYHKNDQHHLQRLPAHMRLYG